MDKNGHIRVESDQDKIDVAEASFVLDMGRMYIQSEWLRQVQEEDQQEAAVNEPTITDE